MSKQSPATMAKNPPKVFYGWWIVLATGTLCAIIQSFYSYGISVFLKPLAAELNLSRAITSSAAGVGKLEAGFEAPITGWIVDKFGPKWVMFGGITVMGAGMILMNYIHSTWAYLLVWGFIIGTGFNLALTIPIDKTITNWFVKKRGIAMGLKFAFIGIGGIAVVPIVTVLNSNYGWRTTNVIWGLVTFASLILVLVFVKQRRPEHYGMLPDGAKLDSASSVSNMVDKGVEYASTHEETEFTLRQAMKTPVFWMLIIAGAGSITTQTAMTVHMIPFLTDRGIGETLAGFMMSVMVFFTIPARFLGGIIVDKVKKGQIPYIMAGSFLLMGIGIGLFLIMPNTVTLYIFLALFGFGSSAPSVVSVLMRGRYFGRKAYGSISGTASLITAPMGLLAPIYAGWVFDSTHSYTTAFIVFGVMAMACAIMMVFAKPPKAPVQTGELNKII